jgi:multiple sugar transport system permease protein
MKRKTGVYWLFLLPSLIGVLLFYVIPFGYSFYYALIDNMGTQKFVGMQNFKDTLTNELFQSAAMNTVVFIGLSVPLGVGIGLALSLCLRRMKGKKAVAATALLLPLVVPSGTIVYFWKVLFDSNGLWQKFLLQLGLPHEWVSQNQWTMGILVVVFLWKNVSYNIVLFWSGLNWIPEIYYEQARLEGASSWQQFCHITWVYLSPTTFVVLLMSIVNSFKVFKEVYMLYGAYPSPDIYMLQHYMNNQFLSLNMQKLSSAAYILFLVLGIILLILFYAQKKVTDAYQ